MGPARGNKMSSGRSVPNSNWGAASDARHSVEVGVEASQGGQPVIVHDHNEKSVVGQEAVLTAHVSGPGDLRAADRQDGDWDRCQIIDGLTVSAESPYLGRGPPEPIGHARQRTAPPQRRVA